MWFWFKSTSWVQQGGLLNLSAVCFILERWHQFIHYRNTPTLLLTYSLPQPNCYNYHSWVTEMTVECVQDAESILCWASEVWEERWKMYLMWSNTHSHLYQRDVSCRYGRSWTVTVLLCSHTQVLTVCSQSRNCSEARGDSYIEAERVWYAEEKLAFKNEARCLVRGWKLQLFVWTGSLSKSTVL